MKQAASIMLISCSAYFTILKIEAISFSENVGWFSPGYTALYPKRQQFSQPSFWESYYLNKKLIFSQTSLYKILKPYIVWYYSSAHLTFILLQCPYCWRHKISMKFWEELVACFILIRHGSYRECFLQQFFASAGTSLPSSYLATIEGYTETHTDWWEGFMKYVVEMGWSVMLHLPSFIQIGSGIQKLMGWRGTHRHTDTQTSLWNHKHTFNFSK
jgi:hypothetical protein